MKNVSCFDDEETPSFIDTIITNAPKRSGRKYRSRVKELRHVAAGDILPNPKNWRVHPFTQRTALRDVLSRIGFADAVIARDTPDGLMLLDGHARVNETPPDMKIPVLVVDLDDEEADLLLATLDPLAAMATSDENMLKELARSLVQDDDTLTSLLDTMKIRYDEIDEATRDEAAELEREKKRNERVDNYTFEYKIVIKCADEQAQAALLVRFEKEGLECQALML